MNGLQRTLNFLRREPVDRPPFHPILMRWAAAHAGVNYRDFCLDYRRKCPAMLQCADEFDLDWVTVLSDPFCEASAFGLEIDYPENSLPIDTGGHLPDAESASQLQPYHVGAHQRTRNRIEEIREFHRQAGDRLFIVGWVEGPVAEYADLRGVSEAAMDLIDEPELVLAAIKVILAAAKDFITVQVEAGAHCIGIGDAFCSQIGPKLYRQFAWEGERQLVDHIHRLGALAKLHICGNTTALLPDMIRTGADIIDVDHLVADMRPFARLLAPHQVLSGNPDPVSVIQDGSPSAIRASVGKSFAEAGGRCIVSAGCEITPGTSLDNFRAFRDAAGNCPCSVP